MGATSTTKKTYPLFRDEDHIFYLFRNLCASLTMSLWFKEICSVRVGDIVGNKRDIVAVEASTPVGEVLDILKNENITSIGVYGTPGRL